ncbi:MAG: Holliday junction branch migration protein RuvA [Gammaproteobacteria bacterium]|nr:Holliday junction branch migration protein RuvA [Gammaproteobacteria bacterium]
MIGSLRGTLTEVRPPVLLVEISGVGYEVHAPMTCIYRLPATGEQVFLYIHHVQREDAQLLFGFTTADERELFRALIKVNSIGAKMALGILSGMEADEFIRCIADGDATRLTALPGVGKKTAERLIVEMRDGLRNLTGVERLATSGAAAAKADPVADAVSGLIALGYRPAEASRFVHALDCQGMTSEAIIREALKALLKS